MGYLDSYNAVRNRYKKYLTGSRIKKLLDLSRDYSRQNSFNRMGAVTQLQTGFRTGYNGLRNIGMQNSGEAERLRRRLGAQFVYANDQLKKNEGALLEKTGQSMKNAARRARALAAEQKAQEEAAREKTKKSGLRGTTGRILRTVR